MNKKYIVFWILILGLLLIFLSFDMKNNKIEKTQEVQDITIEKLDIEGNDIIDTENNISVSNISVETHEELNIQRK